MKLAKFSKCFAAASVALFSLSAFAHVGADAGSHHGFATGFMHPLTGLDHLAAMLAVGVWSALTARRIWAAPLAFASLLLAGALLAQAGLNFPAVEPMIAASMVVIGLLLAAQKKLPEAAGAALVGGFALFHGAAHGQELAGAGALLGMVVGTALMHAAGLGLGLALRGRSAGLARVAGTGVGLLGVVMGWSLIAA
ncbi:MAG: HupE/UreJ family protein [Hydrogenophaga sp.]